MELNTMPRLRRVALIKEIFAYDNLPDVTRSDTAKHFNMAYSTVSSLLRGITHQEDIKYAGVYSIKSKGGTRHV